ncbi:metallophosphoesterase [Nocardioides insulae]|uniref:metallophosphoesterase n=1 Tax=Nocardioides insulae TaxID=394734 RepID=UPI00040026F2|nr:metallophosphoesterase [Nocardioides insulae]
MARPTTLPTWARVLTYVGVWVVLALASAVLVFLHTDREINVASHDAVLQPTFSGKVVLESGPVLPDVRIDSGSPIGVDITLGKTDADSTGALLQRYAYLAGSPEGPVHAVQGAVEEMAVSALLRGAAIAAIPVLVWALLGAARRRELLDPTPSVRGGVAVLTAAALGVVIWQPWSPDGEEPVAGEWEPLATFLGPEVPVPEELVPVEVRGDVTTDQTQRLITSAVDTYDKSKVFYGDAAEAAADLPLREPAEDEIVVLLVSDRHDNIGMDQVARAVADAGGATAVFDAGDDTSTGAEWEGFSLDSLDAAFHDFDRYAVTGNHDHGDFVGQDLADKGWTMLDGEIVEGPGESTLLGVPDPRSSGLGNWRDEGGLSFTEVGDRLADAACEEGRVGTLLLHDANLGKETLRRGCADLVVGGHLHVQVGPTKVAGEGEEPGWTYTNGTTGGAAYAVALGSKPRRQAEVTLITYRDGRPVGIQPVELQTNGVFTVDDYVELSRPE